MKAKFCGDLTAHGRHEWYWKRILRRDCMGLVVEFCGRYKTHPPHWHGERSDKCCYGSGLAGLCEHGVGMLDECEPCATAAYVSRLLAAEDE